MYTQAVKNWIRRISRMTREEYEKYCCRSKAYILPESEKDWLQEPVYVICTRSKGHLSDIHISYGGGWTWTDKDDRTCFATIITEDGTKLTCTQDKSHPSNKHWDSEFCQSWSL